VKIILWIVEHLLLYNGHITLKKMQKINEVLCLKLLACIKGLETPFTSINCAFQYACGFDCDCDRVPKALVLQRMLGSASMLQMPRRTKLHTFKTCMTESERRHVLAVLAQAFGVLGTFSDVSLATKHFLYSRAMRPSEPFFFWDAAPLDVPSFVEHPLAFLMASRHVSNMGFNVVLSLVIDNQLLESAAVATLALGRTLTPRNEALSCGAGDVVSTKRCRVDEDRIIAADFPRSPERVEERVADAINEKPPEWMPPAAKWEARVVENSMLRTLFVLLFWDVVQKTSSAIFPDIFKFRSSLFRERAGQLRKLSRCQLADEVSKAFEDHKYKPCVGIVWPTVDVCFLKKAVHAMGAFDLVAVLFSMSADFKSLASGHPDLFVMKPQVCTGGCPPAPTVGRRPYMFVEVKDGEKRDFLRQHQRAFHALLRRCGAPVIVVEAFNE
jgi:hypothetical protein